MKHSRHFTHVYACLLPDVRNTRTTVCNSGVQYFTISSEDSSPFKLFALALHSGEAETCIRNEICPRLMRVEITKVYMIHEKYCPCKFIPYNIRLMLNVYGVSEVNSGLI
jgi:hypothetical protein